MQILFFLRKTALLSFFVASQVTQAQTLPEVSDVDLQPLKAQIQRLIQATDYLGEPLSAKTKRRLSRALGQADAARELLAKVHETQFAELKADILQKLDPPPAKP